MGGSEANHRHSGAVGKIFARMNLPTALPVIFLAALAGAQTTLDPNHTHRIEAAFTMGGHFGGITSEDEALYKDVGLQVVDKDGKGEAVEASAVGVGVSIAYWRVVDTKVSFGAAYQYINGSESPVPAVKGQDPQDLFEANLLTARARLLPLDFHPHRFGIEVAAGYGFGTLHRFPLAADQIDVVVSGVDDLELRDQVRSYILEGNEPVDIRGPRFEMLLVSTRQFTESVGLVVKLGYDVSLWTLTGSDPLQLRGRKYPTQISSHGVGLQIGLGGSF